MLESKVTQHRISSRIQIYTFIIERILKFKMLSQFICTDANMLPLYLQFATKESSNKKNDQYKSHLEFENLLLYYIIKTQI